MTSPTAPGGDDLDGFEYRSLAEDEATADTDPTPATDDAALPSPEGTEPPDPTPATGETTADARTDASVPSPGTSADPSELQPDQLMYPEGGVPFTFVVDGLTVAPEGAVQYPDGAVLLPTKAWDQLRGNNLADRGAWRQKEQQYQRQVQEARTAAEQGASQQVRALTVDRDRKSAALAEFEKIVALGPDELYDWCQNFAVNRPALEARMDAASVRAELDAVRSQTQRYETEADQRTQAEQDETDRTQCEAHLDYALTDLLTKEFPGVAQTPQDRAELKDHVVKTLGGVLFYRDPEAGLQMRVDLLREVLGREKKRAQGTLSDAARTLGAAQRNTAALAPTLVRRTPAKAVAAPAVKAKWVDHEEVLGSRNYLTDE